MHGGLGCQMKQCSMYKMKRRLISGLVIQRSNPIPFFTQSYNPPGVHLYCPGTLEVEIATPESWERRLGRELSSNRWCKFIFIQTIIIIIMITTITITIPIVIVLTSNYLLCKINLENENDPNGTGLEV